MWAQLPLHFGISGCATRPPDPICWYDTDWLVKQTRSYPDTRIEAPMHLYKRLCLLKCLLVSGCTHPLSEIRYTLNFGRIEKVCETIGITCLHVIWRRYDRQDSRMCVCICYNEQVPFSCIHLLIINLFNNSALEGIEQTLWLHHRSWIIILTIVWNGSSVCLFGFDHWLIAW